MAPRSHPDYGLWAFLRMRHRNGGSRMAAERLEVDSVRIEVVSVPQVDGSTSCTCAGSKSRWLSVTSARSCASAVAAIRLSLIDIGLPRRRRSASSCAQRSPTAESQEMHWIRLIPRSNQLSNSARRAPRAKSRMPKRTSPRTIGSTTIERSLRRSHSIDPRIWVGLGRLGEDVGVDEVLHSVSVDSESMATK